jgi:hypothetical protein
VILSSYRERVHMSIDVNVVLHSKMLVLLLVFAQEAHKLGSFMSFLSIDEDKHHVTACRRPASTRSELETAIYQPWPGTILGERLGRFPQSHKRWGNTHIKLSERAFAA